MNDFQLDNTDIRWRGDYFGLRPTISDQARDFLENLPSDGYDLLIRNLHDSRRFVLCHVILAKLHGSSRLSKVGTWHGLAVDLKGDGEVSTDPAQIPELIEFWRNQVRELKGSGESKGPAGESKGSGKAPG